MAVPVKDGRFDQVTWLKAALEVLARDGQAKLNVEKLAASLGVTKGSFYHHFQGKEDFVKRLIAYWEEEFTYRQRAALEASKAPPCERLFQIMFAVQRERLTRYDIAFRSWAAQDSAVAEAVRRVDATRFEAIKAIFAEIGFEEEELHERTLVWLLFHSALGSVQVPEETPVTAAVIRSRLKFLTDRRCQK